MFNIAFLGAIKPDKLTAGILWYVALFLAFIAASVIVLTLLFTKDSITKAQQDHNVLALYKRHVDIRALKDQIEDEKKTRKAAELGLQKQAQDLATARTQLALLAGPLKVSTKDVFNPTTDIASTPDNEKIVAQRQELLSRAAAMASASEVTQMQLDNINRDINAHKEKLKGKNKLDLEPFGLKPDHESIFSLMFVMFETGWGGLLFFPTEGLTMLLTMLMGATGGFMHVIRVFLDDEHDKTAIWYFSRPFLGIITALAMFVLMKAGQMTFTSGGGDTLNPYFVAFLGIISGLLANEAYETLNRAGVALFRRVEPARYAFGLKREMTAQNIAPDALAAQLGVKKEVVESWVSEAQPVPAEHQRPIGAFLKKPLRELFSDQPPP